ncbi:hypothetical protein JVU11DRAFT_9648 [Chiua virens]|nr:hypothetical protein JVU11DRAFT_9648 [Chiua virens]
MHFRSALLLNPLLIPTFFLLLWFTTMHLPKYIKPKRTAECQTPGPEDTLTHRLNSLLKTSGPGYILSLCPGQQYIITAPLRFTAPNQEISTAGYPTDSTRATLVVAGLVRHGKGHSTAVDGTCGNCDGVKLRNVQINGTRLGAPPIDGGANIEMGGPNSNQLIEYVHSFDPRSWSCLHVAQGPLTCTNATVQNNDIGPAGSDLSRQWADGISVACHNSLIRNNMVNNPTDGGIVLFGSPGTRVENNTIWVETETLLGGINLVDVSPFDGNYSDVVVTNNTIAGAFASEPAKGSKTKGTNKAHIIIKIGIAIGPRVWFGTHYGSTVSFGATVRDNQLTGAFGYGMAISSAKEFTVENNVLIGNTSFIGVQSPGCPAHIPHPAPFVIDHNTVSKSTIQHGFTSISNADHLICISPPDGGDLWPFGGIPDLSAPSVSPPELAATSPIANSGHPSVAPRAGMIIGAIAAVIPVISNITAKTMAKFGSLR